MDFSNNYNNRKYCSAGAQYCFYYVQRLVVVLGGNYFFKLVELVSKEVV